MAFPGTVRELEVLLKANQGTVDDELLARLASDRREGIQRIYRQVLVRKQAEEAEKKRLAALFAWERQLGSPAVTVAGVDEAGRGPLAGPVAAAAVVLEPDTFLPGLDDSKRKSPAERLLLEGLIKEKCRAWSVGWASVEEIDRLNILQATFLAMRRALQGLPLKVDYVLVDGMAVGGLTLPQKALVKGDSLSASIAAASILAKTARDRLMEEMHRLYPQYGFDRHKGYPTREHYAALAKYGPCPLHRRSFGDVAAKATNVTNR